LYDAGVYRDILFLRISPFNKFIFEDPSIIFGIDII